MKGERNRIRAKATGSYSGEVLKVDPETAERIGLGTLISSAVAGATYALYELFKKVFYAIPHASTLQPFIITGFKRDIDGSFSFLGHCVDIKKSPPRIGEEYVLVIDGDFCPGNINSRRDVINKYFQNLYNNFSKSLETLIMDPSKRRQAVLVGSQIGLWLITNNISMEEVRSHIRRFQLNGVDENYFILKIFEAIQQTGYSILSLNASYYLFQFEFKDEKIKKELEDLRKQAMKGGYIIGQSRE